MQTGAKQMANMSYCRFHNTLMDLSDCTEVMQEEEELPRDGSDEHQAMLRLIEVCRDIVDNADAG